MRAVGGWVGGVGEAAAQRKAHDGIVKWCEIVFILRDELNIFEGQRLFFVLGLD